MIYEACSIAKGVKHQVQGGGGPPSYVCWLKNSHEVVQHIYHKPKEKKGVRSSNSLFGGSS
jgi:hypothetical protein